MQCYDGNPNIGQVSAGLCSQLDLSAPHHLKASDWVVSLEVRERRVAGCVGTTIGTFLETPILGP